MRMSEARFARLAAIFRQATRLEADFWEMGLTRAM
jgi:thiaminase/transcriptional activator TenA